jgi:hypothetical protein
MDKRQSILVHIVRMELSLVTFLPCTELLGQDMMTEVEAVFHHGQLLGLMQSDMMAFINYI